MKKELKDEKLLKQDQYLKYGNLTKYFSMKTRRMNIPFSGTLELTPLCNMNCKMCYIRMTKQEMEKVGTSLSADEWIRIATEAVAAGMTMVLFTGGEAILHKDFKKIYLAVRKMGVFVSINTNGTTITDEWIEFFKQYPPSKFNITIYGGCNETYNRLCGNPRGFDQLKTAIEKLQKNHFHIVLNCTLSKQNVCDIEQIFSFGKLYGLEVHATTYNFPPVRKEGVSDAEISRMTPREAAKANILLNWYEYEKEEFIYRMKNITEASKYAERHDACKVDVEGEKIRCAAGRSNFWITWDGRMLPCGMIPDSSLNIKGQSFIDVWNKTVELTNKITLAPECKNCNKKNLCAPCAAKLKSETGRYDQKASYMCEFVDEYIAFAKKAYQIMCNENATNS